MAPPWKRTIAGRGVGESALKLRTVWEGDRRGAKVSTGAAIQQLPADAQDAIATRLLAEVADEHGWAERFEDTTDAQWDRLAASVRQGIATEELVSLDDVFPSREHP